MKFSKPPKLEHATAATPASCEQAAAAAAAAPEDQTPAGNSDSNNAAANETVGVRTRMRTGVKIKASNWRQILDELQYDNVLEGRLEGSSTRMLAKQLRNLETATAVADKFAVETATTVVSDAAEQSNGSGAKHQRSAAHRDASTGDAANGSDGQFSEEHQAPKMRRSGRTAPRLSRDDREAIKLLQHYTSCFWEQAIAADAAQRT